MNKIAPAQLLPADVLLYHGDSFVARLIRLFDGSNYSHASIFDGTNITEAIGDAITVRSVAASCGDAPYVDVFRYVASDGTPLGSPALPAAPILARIQYYQNHRQRYAYEEILLLAALAATRRLPIPGLGLVIRPILDTAADLLARLIAGNREPVICSELVFRCYDEAQPPCPILIRDADVLGAAAVAQANTASTPAEIELQQQIVDFLSTYALAKHAVPAAAALPAGLSAAAAATSAFDAGALAVANFVTPRDLFRSPNLRLAGRLVVPP